MIKTVADLEAVADSNGALKDNLGQAVGCLYAFNPPHYAVYAAGRRVMIMYADDAAEAHDQRDDLAQLAPLRGEIDGLIDGWREGSNHTLLGHSSTIASKALRYNRRVADALVLALEKSIPRATETLTKIKQDILDERVARARFEYLIAAMMAAVTLMFFAWMVTATYPLHLDMVTRGGRAIEVVDGAGARMVAVGWLVVRLGLVLAASLAYVRFVGNSRETLKQWPVLQGWLGALGPSLLLLLGLLIVIWPVLMQPSFAPLYSRRFGGDHLMAATMWQAAAAAAVGAFFSIAIGIRGRTVLPDLLRTANLMDATLRVAIGFIAGAVLVALIREQVVMVQIGSRPLADQGTLGVLIYGFLAGFSERLVPDLLEKTNLQQGTAALPPAKKAEGKDDKAGGDGKDGGGKGAGQSGGAPPPGGSEPPLDHAPEQGAEEACLAEHDIDDADLTPDDQLPPASGGVAEGEEQPK